MKIQAEFEFETNDEFVLNLTDKEIKDCLIEDLIEYNDSAKKLE